MTSAFQPAIGFENNLREWCEKNGNKLIGMDIEFIPGNKETYFE